MKLVSVRLTAFLVLVASVLAGGYVRADRMDAESDSYLIEKLARVKDTMDKNDPSRPNVLLRLADLYSERARLADMNDNEKACPACPTRDQDRKTALLLYAEVMPKAEQSDVPRVVLQQAHLHELLGHADQAEKLYESIIKNKKKYSPELLGQAYMGLGEIKFKQIKYKEAEKNYLSALSIKETPRRGYITYRLAWCYFHEDRLVLAKATLEKVLESPGLLAKSDTNAEDTSFHEEASRDYATFLADGDVGDKEIQQLSRLSPESARFDNLKYLASELDRLGKKRSALMVWNVVGADSADDKPKNQIEQHLKLAQIQYDLGHKDLAIAELGKLVESLHKESCGEESECQTVQNTFRKFVTEWGKAEEKHPSQDMIKAYGFYASIYPDAEINYWAAEASQNIKNYTQAATFYRNASNIAADQRNIKTKNGNDKTTEKMNRIFEGSLLGEIAAAELAHDINMRDAAYVNYLDKNPNGPKSFEVKYQRAHILYEKGAYADAADAFKGLALSKSTDKSELSVKTQAADLALDSLVLAKKENLVEPWAKEFAATFSMKRSDYSKIARRAVINQVAHVINDPNASESELHDALMRLQQASLSGTTKEERIAMMKDRLIIAERIKDLGEVMRDADSLLSMRSLSTADRNFAVSRKEWAAEMTLNFKLAFSLARQMRFENVSEQERLLKLATLAELAGYNADVYYKHYLEISQDRATREMVMARLVRSARNPVKAFFKYQNQLKFNPTLYAGLVVEVFGETHDYKLAEDALRSSVVRMSPAGILLNRFVFLKKFESEDQGVARLHLKRNSARGLKVSIQERLMALNRLERSAQFAVDSADWTLQLVTLTAVAKQNRRLAYEISSLPIPRGLNRRQKAEYRKLLAAQTQPYVNKAITIENKIADLWKQSDMIQGLGDELGKTKKGLHRLLSLEARVILNTAPRSQRSSLSRLLAEKHQNISVQNVRELEASVKADPFSASKIEKLKNIEAQIGQETFVAYLDARLSNLNGVGSAAAEGGRK